jgi:hypothetical protein
MICGIFFGVQKVTRRTNSSAHMIGMGTMLSLVEMCISGLKRLKMAV